MCLYIDKARTAKKPKCAKTFYKVVKFNKSDSNISSKYKGCKIDSGWYIGVGGELNSKEKVIHGGAIHVYTTLLAAKKNLNIYNYNNFILPVKCYLEDFIAYGTDAAYNEYNKNPQACYTKVFIHEDDIRAIKKKVDRRIKYRQRKKK